jgi:MSHA biogenesis protein MshP
MCLERRRHAGFTMVSVVFILVVLAALGAALAGISRHQHLAAAADLQAARAYQAARAGMEWAAYWQFKVGRFTPACVPTNTIVPGGTLSGFTVTLRCTLTGPVADGGTNRTFWTLVANACNAPSGGTCPATGAVGETYVEREVVWTIVE